MGVMKLLFAVLIVAAFAWWISRANTPTRLAHRREKLASCVKCGIYFPAPPLRGIFAAAGFRCPECKGELKIFRYECS